MHRTVVAVLLALCLAAAYGQDEGEVQAPGPEAIVIGCGHAGAVAAYHLARVGVKTTILEKGLDWTVRDPTKGDTFPSIRQPDSRAAWLSNETVAPGPLPFSGTPTASFTGLLERVGNTVNPRDPGIRIRTEGPIQVTSGVGVGGGSTVSNGAMMRPTRQNFLQSVGFDTLQTLWSSLENDYYPKAMSKLQATLIPRELDHSIEFKNGRTFREQAEAADYEVNEDDGDKSATQKVPVSVDWDAVQEELDGKRIPSVINGDAWLGINSDARIGVKEYLAEAAASGHVDIKTLHQVTRIRVDEEAEDGGFVVDVNKLTIEGRVEERLQFRSKWLFLAAGSVQTTALLVRSRDRGDLALIGSEVGQQWGNNGETYGVRKTPSFTNPGRGGPASYALFDHVDDQDSITLMPVGAQWSEDDSIIWNQGLGVPTSLGSFDYDAENDEVVIHWPSSPNPSQRTYDAMFSIFQDLDAANHRSRGSLDPIEVASGHTLSPLGGVVFGVATDTTCRLSGYDGLYVIDSSLLPGSCGFVQPALTVTAMAERCMERITERDGVAGNAGLSSSDAPLATASAFLIGSLAMIVAASCL